MNLIIVESPTKAKTISKMVGDDFKVLSSYGHIRDLPKSKLGIDVEHNFKPSYIIPIKARKNVSLLKKEAQKSKKIILATDEDREGEAIAWHIAQALDLENKKDKETQRIVFHEITKKAIEEALKNPRQIDADLVNAQQARRVLDRLVGYELSPFLWKKIARGLSAGRVQSVALRLIVEREKEIRQFKPQEYWSLIAAFLKDNKEFNGELFRINNKQLKKFDLKEREAKEIIAKIKNQKFSVIAINKKLQKRNPLPPFTTSTLQQEASKKLFFSAKKTMMIAQMLYEGIRLGTKDSTGLITYMRTDSLNLSQESLVNGRRVIASLFGKDELPENPRFYKTKSKTAQEAHEAIRPTDPSLIPEKIKQWLTADQFKLYNLIWQRFIASQMKEAQFETVSVDIKAENEYFFRANGRIIIKKGFLLVWPLKMEDVELPVLQEGDKIKLKNLTALRHETQPPARYSEATLVKKLEEEGIGRPSTYAPTMSTIQNRGYVIKNKQRKFEPTEIGELVNKVLVEHFPNIVDIKFTREMEEDLDLIAQGKKEWVKITKEFYLPFHSQLEKKYQEVSKQELVGQETDELCEKCNNKMIIKWGRFGKFMACSNFPECKNTKPLPGQGKNKLRASSMEICPECGRRLAIRKGRYGYFLGCSGYPECKYIKKLKVKNEK